jgi:hypothetical protein
MRVHHRVLYISGNVIRQINCPGDWWDAFKFTRAVKSALINGYAHIPDGAVWRRLQQDNVGLARTTFGTWLAATAAAHAPDGQYCIVPVPSSDAVVGAAGPHRHSTMLADALAGHQPAPQTHDILRFTEPVARAHAGGRRDEEFLFPLIAIEGNLPQSPIVLLDDVVTLGGHLKAAKRRLEASGATVLFGITCGRTVLATDGDPWQPSFIDLA